MQPFEDHPKMLHHPDTGADAVARDAKQEAMLVAQGFVAPHSDPTAFERAQAAPFRPDFVVEEWPKWVDGKLVDQRPQPAAFQAYPKALTPPGGGPQVFVASAEDERVMLDRWATPSKKKGG